LFRKSRNHATYALGQGGILGLKIDRGTCVKYFQPGDSQIYYEQYGAGEPIVFTHGWLEFVSTAMLVPKNIAREVFIDFLRHFDIRTQIAEV